MLVVPLLAVALLGSPSGIASQPSPVSGSTPVTGEFQVSFYVPWPDPGKGATYRFALPRHYAYGDPPMIWLGKWKLDVGKWNYLSAEICERDGLKPNEALVRVRPLSGGLVVALTVRSSPEPFDPNGGYSMCHSFFSPGAAYRAVIYWRP